MSTNISATGMFPENKALPPDLRRALKPEHPRIYGEYTVNI